VKDRNKSRHCASLVPAACLTRKTRKHVSDVYESGHVLSTGGTLTALTGAQEDIGADICDVVCVIKKDDGQNKLAEAGYDAKTLINVVVEDGEVVVTDEHGDG